MPDVTSQHQRIVEARGQRRERHHTLRRRQWQASCASPDRRQPGSLEAMGRSANEATLDSRHRSPRATGLPLMHDVLRYVADVSRRSLFVSHRCRVRPCASAGSDAVEPCLSHAGVGVRAHLMPQVARTSLAQVDSPPTEAARTVPSGLPDPDNNDADGDPAPVPADLRGICSKSEGRASIDGIQGCLLCWDLLLLQEVGGGFDIDGHPAVQNAAVSRSCAVVIRRWAKQIMERYM